MKYLSQQILLIISIVILIGCGTQTDNVKPNNDKPNNVFITNFFDLYEENPREAILDIYKSSKWLRMNINQVDTAFIKLRPIINQLGDYRGYEVIKTIDVGASYKIISALGKYDRQPIRFNFILYKPDNKWQIQNFNYDLNVESELEQNITLSFDY